MVGEHLPRCPGSILGCHDSLAPLRGTILGATCTPGAHLSVYSHGNRRLPSVSSPLPSRTATHVATSFKEASMRAKMKKLVPAVLLMSAFGLASIAIWPQPVSGDAVQRVQVRSEERRVGKG